VPRAGRWGPTVDSFRRSYLLPHRDAAWAIVREALDELADGGSAVAWRFTAESDGAARATVVAVERESRALAQGFDRQRAS
jgi:hypothetical protein